MSLIVKGGGSAKQEKTVTAGTGIIEVFPDTGKLLSKVVVNPTPSQSKGVTPNESSQTVSPDSGKLLSSVSVGAIQTEEKTVTAGTSATTVTPTSGKYIKKVTVNPTPSQSKTVTPSTSQKTVSPDSGKLLSSVKVNGDSDLVAKNIRRGVSIFGVTGTFEKLTLEELSWAEISDIINSGGAKSWFSLKDSKTVTLTSGEQIVVEIAGFDIDTYTSGGTAPVTFVTKNCLNTTRVMNSSNTNANGWNGSEMRAYCNGDLYNLLPSDLKALVKAVNKKTSSGSKSSTIQTTSDKLWLLSGFEVSGSSSNAKWYDGEGTQYPIFTDNASRIKYKGSTAQYWWLRSPHYNSNSYWCRVRPDGDTSWHNATMSYGVVVGFCI